MCEGGREARRAINMATKDYNLALVRGGGGREEGVCECGREEGV